MSSLIHRPRRLRRTEAVRALVREARLSPENLILPLFACPGEGVRREVSSMPGVFNLSTDQVAREAAAAFDAGVQAVILFGLPESKEETATGAYAERGIVQEAIRAVRRAVPEMVVIADTCLCEYTSHGHCGVVRGGEVLNDESLELIARTAVSQAAEGADILMVKPAGPYLDVLRTVRERFDLPLAAYHVSGEYAMLKAAAQRGWIDEKRAMLETLTGIRRAGADVILTYYAVEAARELNRRR